MLEMKCPALMNGYHNRPDVPPPFTKDGFYITGDVLRRDENGFHYFVGRTDDMFVSGGENIYPTDVERMLEQHPDVGQAVVIPVDDDIKGTKPVAFVIPEGRPQADRGGDQDIRAEKRAGLSAPALRLVRRRIAARLDQQGRPQRAAQARAGARRAKAAAKVVLSPIASITGFQRASSSAMYCQCRVAGIGHGLEAGIGQRPSRTPASATAFLLASVRRSTTGAGVLAGRVDAEEKLADHVRHALFDGGRNIRRGLQTRLANSSRGCGSCRCCGIRAPVR